MSSAPISKVRFDALAGYTRSPQVTMLCEEQAWLSSQCGRVLGVLLRDRTDEDFSWVVLARDRLLRFRAIDLGVSLETIETARSELVAKVEHHAESPDESFHQGDETGQPIDFFEPLAPPERLHESFKLLTSHERYSPAQELIAAMMRYHVDIDGNFVEQFQTTGFDTRLWELYLFAVLNELGYARVSDAAVPDFVASGLLGSLGIEATTANAPQSGSAPVPATEQEFTDYFQNYIPIKIARALKRKLNRTPPYWQEPGMAEIPFAVAVQDFHGPGVMRMITPTATEYVFGVRHRIENGVQRIERLTEHRFGNAVEPSGFFSLPGAENVSAVILNPLGTLTKFNRMGFLAGFGSRRVRMIRSGYMRGERRPDGPGPIPFAQEIHTPNYEESWVEGMVVLHNPNARIPLDPDLIPGANHEFLQADGKIMSLIPDFHPYFSQTSIALADETGAVDGE